MTVGVAWPVDRPIRLAGIGRRFRGDRTGGAARAAPRRRAAPRPQRGQHRVDAAGDRQSLGPPRVGPQRRAPDRGNSPRCSPASVSGGRRDEAGGFAEQTFDGRTAMRDARRQAGVRRSAGPNAAGSAATADSVKASLARVAARRRGTASGATVTRTRASGRSGPKVSTSAAPAATPRIRPIARNANSLPVTLSATPSDRAPHRARAVPPGGQRSCEPRPASTWTVRGPPSGPPQPGRALQR